MRQTTSVTASAGWVILSAALTLAAAVRSFAPASPLLRMTTVIEVFRLYFLLVTSFCASHKSMYFRILTPQSL